MFNVLVFVYALLCMSIYYVSIYYVYMCICVRTCNEIYVLIIYNSLMVKRGVFISAMVAQFHLVECYNYVNYGRDILMTQPCTF
jgi:hypothetical protein